MASSPADRIVVACSCGAKLRVPVAGIGKKAKCPKCGNPVIIRAPKPQSASKPAEEVLPPVPGARPKVRTRPVAATAPSALDGGDSLLSALAESESSAEATATQAMASSLCSNCSAPMGADAKVCIACGFDVRRGKVHHTGIGDRPATASAAGKTATGVAKAAGSFVLGTVLSFVGAALAGGLWCLIAWNSKLDIRILAVGVGALAGAGMYVGHRRAHALAGLVAMGITGLTIVGAKAIIFFAILFTVVTGDTDDRTLQKAYVIGNLTEEILDERGLVSEKERESQWNSALKEAEERVAKMHPDEVTAHWKRFRELDEGELDEAEVTEADDSSSELAMSAPDADDDAESESSEDRAGLGTWFFSTMFGFRDAIWFLIALATAFRIASNGVEFGSQS